MNRRSVLRGLAAGAASLLRPLRGAEAAQRAEILPSTLSEAGLEQEREVAIGEIINEFWDKPEAREHITRSYFNGSQDKAVIAEQLRLESRMYIPAPEECSDVSKRYAPAISELARAVSENKYGFFVCGDKQRVYLMQNAGRNKIRFVQATLTSTSIDEWSNRPDSGGTPTGMHRIASKKRGLLGQVVSALNRNVADFVQFPLSPSETGTFVRSLRFGGDSPAEVVTAEFLIVGPSTSPARGIRMHGTNRTNSLGKRGSGGCLRESNVDMIRFWKYVEPTQGREPGTPIMIHATPRTREQVIRERAENNLMETVSGPKGSRATIERPRNLMEEISRKKDMPKRVRNLLEE